MKSQDICTCMWNHYSMIYTYVYMKKKNSMHVRVYEVTRCMYVYVDSLDTRTCVWNHDSHVIVVQIPRNAICRGVLHPFHLQEAPKPHTATHCNTLQRTATHCNTLQHTATHCNTLQHTATHCNTLQQCTIPSFNRLSQNQHWFCGKSKWQMQSSCPFENGK